MPLSKSFVNDRPLLAKTKMTQQPTIPATLHPPSFLGRVGYIKVRLAAKFIQGRKILVFCLIIPPIFDQKYFYLVLVVDGYEI